MAETTVNIKIDSSGDGKQSFKPGTRLKDILLDISPQVIGAEDDDRIYGLEDSIRDSGEYRLLTLDSKNAMKIFWHSTAHLMAQAVKNLYPKAKLGIGPSIRDGFYYDFDFGEQFSSDDLPKVEAEMNRIVKENLPITRDELEPSEALNFFGNDNQDFKLELIEEINEQISTYSQGDFTDLCRGPHMPSTGYLKHFKLTSVTGAYWRGDERNQMLQRIYGTAYPTSKLLKVHLKRIEVAKKRDHRLLGKQLDLFGFHPEAPGAVFWHPKGYILVKKVKEYIRDLLDCNGYGEVNSPLIMTRNLWEKSGHWDHYHNNMYFTSVDKRDYAVKPMNCPGAVLIYQERQWSYRDLPLRWSEMGIVHRYEKSGTLHGLFRVRQITQDDAHIFCASEQLVSEIVALIRLIIEAYNHFGMTNLSIELSTRPKDRIGSDQLWDRAEDALRQALVEEEIEFDTNSGEGAFYGPKIDFHFLDSLNRNWQLGTVQLDFNFPERFELEYIGSDNLPHRPIMLHRTIMGSVERFIGILIEHYGGDFPLWLAPVQAIVLPITDNQHDAAEELLSLLQTEGIRTQIDKRGEKIGKKIRESENNKIPYMLVIGQREAEAGQVSLRRRGKGDSGAIKWSDLIEKMKDEIHNLNKSN